MSNGRSRVFLVAPHASYRIPAYLNAAKSMGIETLIVSDSKQSLVNEIASGLHVDFNDTLSSIDKILASANTSPVTGIIATDDRTVEIASVAAGKLGLRCNSTLSSRISRWKHLARQTLLDAGLPVPKFDLINLSDNLHHQLSDTNYPCVIKPLNMSASRGVIRANNTEELSTAVKRVSQIVQESEEHQAREYLLLEEYIPGTEVAIEAMLVNGEFVTLAIFDKPDPLEGPYFEETYYITPSRLADSIQNDIINTTAAGCKAIGLVTGPIHAELRINDQGVFIIEIAARTIGGECARLLEFTTGHSLESLVLANATGNNIHIKPLDKSAGVLMIPTPKAGILRRVEGVLNASNIEHITDVYIAVREGHELQTLPEGSGYLGFIFASADDPDTVEQALRKAHRCLNIVVAPLWKIEKV